MHQTSFHKGIFFILLSASGMSLVALFGKLGLADFHVAPLLFWRYVAAFSLLLATLLVFGKTKGINKTPHLKMHLLRACFVLMAQLCFYSYLSKTNLLNASALLSTGPLFISLIEWSILRKKVGISSWVGAIVSFIGALLILQPDVGVFSMMSLIGLFSGLFQGASQVVFGVQSEREEAPHIGVLHLFAICMGLSLFSLLFFPFGMQPGKSFTSWDLILFIALGIASIFNQFFRAKAYSHGTPSRLSPYLYFSVLLAGIWDWLFFGNKPNIFSSTGAAFIVFGGILKMYLRHWIVKRRGS